MIQTPSFNDWLILQIFASLVDRVTLMQCCPLQGHEAWIQDVCFGANKRWIVTCAKVIILCNTIQSMLTQPALLSPNRMAW